MNTNRSIVSPLIIDSVPGALIKFAEEHTGFADKTGYIWQDGIAYKNRGFYQDHLKTILWTGDNRKQRYDQFVKDLESFGFRTAAGHLKAAGNEAFTFLRASGITYSTTSPLEREMRELNRRADVGVRWSTPGVENVLKVLFHYRLNLKPET